MSAIDHYILDEDGTPVPEPDLLTWARWFEAHTKDRIVAKDTVGEVRVSTVFLGLDHAFFSGPPLLYETMIFGGPDDGYQERCSTRTEAVKQHEAALMLVNAP